MMFEDMIGVSTSPAPYAERAPDTDGVTELQRQLYTDDPKQDRPRRQAKDLALDAMLYEMRKRHERYRNDAFLDMVGAKHTSPPPHSPPTIDLFDFDVQEEEDRWDAGAAFERYLVDDFGTEPTTFEASLGGTLGVFPIKPETYNPVLEGLPPNYATLAKFGYSEPVTDPYGNLMREALRKLVRSV
jgi:hypothetical protein